ncbi:MAG TPA: thiol reductant ABC exporter subunit CydD [Marinospirillum sp.]|uniref:thiol reductant ABC exporter subunit CydD n=1 Tax=Marinospirillum sp. TaxID=2183934 RepID=UPI002B48157C|nr:thiol reductant ABC exporter subunit CydD [Marinospirillum sp.]HKM14299.1 thiol reductant ABC exporter subunit CydD [Marinospirillum sp.]
MAITEPNKARRNREWLRHLASGERNSLLVTQLAGIAQTLVIMAQLALMAWLINEVIVNQRPLAEILSGFVGLVLLLLLRSGLQILQDLTGQAAANRIRLTVRQTLLQQLALLGPVHLTNESAAGLTSQWLEQVDALQNYFARYLPQMTLAVISPLFILILTFYLDWVAGVFLLISAPLIPLFMALVGMGAERLNQQHFVLLKRVSGQFLDSVRGLTSLQLFGLSKQATQDVASAADEYRRINMRTLKLAFLSSAVLEFFSSIAIAAVAMYIGFGLLGYINWGPAADLTLFSGLLILLMAPEYFQPLRVLAQFYHDRASALGAADSLVDLLEVQPVTASSSSSKNTDSKTAEQNSTSKYALEAQDLTLNYAGRGQVLAATSFKLAKGELLLITGRTGSGKSSLLHLMAGFMQPTSGQLLVNGKTPGSEPLIWMHQQAFIINASWADNLRLAAPNASEEALLKAIEAVGLAPLLAQQKDGLNTLLLERGKNLSGGQAQRLALARALLTPSKLVLLDEPTASLDARSRQQIYATLEALKAQGCTLIIASHEPELEAFADQRLALTDQHLKLPTGIAHAPA